MHTFTKTKDPTNRYDYIDVTISTATENLDELVEAFEYYLRASGFSLESRHLEFVNDGDVDV